MRRTASAAAVMAMTAALLPIPATLSPASAEPENDESVEPIIVDRITPDSADEDSTLRVSGEVTNTTESAVEDVTVQLRYSRHPFTSREELDEFSSGDGWQPDASGPDEEFEGELDPEGTLEYSLSTPVDDLGLDSPGVYPMVVEALHGDGNSLGAQYTFLPYTEDDDIPSLDVAWVWPLMDDPQRADDDTFLSDELHDSVGAEGRLGRLLQAGAQVPLSFEAGDDDLVELLGLEDEEEADPLSPTAGEDVTAEDTADTLPADETAEAEDEDADSESGSDDPEADDEADEEADEEAEAEDEDVELPVRTEGIPVTWSVDPGTLDDVLRIAATDHEILEEVLADPAENPVRHDRAADEAAQVWLREAREVLAADNVVASPYANSDLVSLLRNGMDADAEASLRIGEEAVLESLDLEADETFAVPPEGLMEENVQELFAEQGAHRFLLDEEAVPPASWISTTPTAQAPLAPGDAEGDEEPYALVADSGLADVLSMPSHGPGESALALQRFAAETAMIAGENVGGDRTVVAYPEPGWDPSPEFAEGVLEATDELPWLSAERLESVELSDSDEREDTRQDLNYPDHAYGEELSSIYLGQIEDVSRDVRLFNSILVGDSDPFRPSMVRLESVYWREREAMAGATRVLVGQAVQDRMEDVRVIPGEPVTMASSTGITGVLVANDLEDEAVFVHLSVFSENAERLAIGNYTSSFEIAPGARTTVYVPLSARINGSTTVHVSLQNADGEPISAQDTRIQVNATGLGTQALLISGIGLLILIAALAPRAFRKWARRQSAKANAAAAGKGPGKPGTEEGEGGAPQETEGTENRSEAEEPAEAGKSETGPTETGEPVETEEPAPGGSAEAEAEVSAEAGGSAEHDASAGDEAPAEDGAASEVDTQDTPDTDLPDGESRPGDSGTGK
ncbi:DUF6049 family protein [Nocardiopsis nanhaiensis]